MITLTPFVVSTMAGILKGSHDAAANPGYHKDDQQLFHWSGWVTMLLICKLSCYTLADALEWGCWFWVVFETWYNLMHVGQIIYVGKYAGTDKLQRKLFADPERVNLILKIIAILLTILIHHFHEQIDQVFAHYCRSCLRLGGR